ncbi:MAG TPA: hypothetical protein VGO73_09165 [Pyrinomonadaceae bacterium]|jgi:hypothetical protein|nr:hypothetical protein [Pyrinomonadaceae bacterium]
MTASREKLEDQLEEFESDLKGFSSFAQELKTTTAKLGTEPAQFEEDLQEAEHNVKFYEGEVARIKKELAGSPQEPPPKCEPDYILPKTTKQGLGSVIFSSISFLAGALLGSRLKSRKDK